MESRALPSRLPEAARSGPRAQAHAPARRSGHRTGARAAWLCLGACAVAVLLGPGPPARAESPKRDWGHAYETRLGNLQADATRLQREFANPVARFADHPVEKRLVDARVEFELHNYEGAAVLLLDAMDHPEFRRSRDYQPTAMLLGRALMHIGNVGSAKRYFRVAVNGADSHVADEALYYLIDMALEAGDKVALRDLVSATRNLHTNRTRYAVGKALFMLGEEKSALATLQAVGRTSTDSGAGADANTALLARYYVGVVLTALKRYDDALAAFQQLASLKPANEAQKRARELALLAMGRLYMERGRIEQAVTAYQQVSRKGTSYEVALYEMAWAYVKREQYDQAVRTVDILLMVVSDDQVDVQAHVLRGRLAIMMRDFDEAVASYEKILKRFAPIRNELDRFAADPTNIDRFYAWLLDRYSAAGQMAAPLSEKAAAWVSSTPEMKRVAGVFDAVSMEQKQIRDTTELAQELKGLVTAANRVERFPKLKEGWTRALALQNQLLLLSTEMLDREYRLARASLPGPERDDLEALVNVRHDLEARLARIPMTYDQYEDRQAKVDQRYLDLERKSFLVAQTLKQLQRQLLAVEKYVNERQYASGGKKMSLDHEEQIRATINDEKTKMIALREELLAVQRAIRAESRRVGTGDAVTQGEAAMRATVIGMHKRESMRYERLAVALPDAAQRDVRRYAELRQQCWDAIKGLDGTVRAIDARVTEKTNKLLRLVQLEMANLASYAEEMASQAESGRAIARGVGEELFHKAHERMRSVVLEADVGLIDVAWQRKVDRTHEIQDLNQERARKLQALHEASERLLREDEAVGPAGHAAPSVKPASAKPQAEQAGADEDETAPSKAPEGDAEPSKAAPSAGGGSPAEPAPPTHGAEGSP